MSRTRATYILLSSLVCSLALVLFPSPTSAAITYFGTSANPADGGSATEPQFPMVLTPPANMQAGDLIIMYGFERNVSAANLYINDTGGQTWGFDIAGSCGVDTAFAEYWAVYNGTWSTLDFWFEDITGTNSSSVMLFVFRPPQPGGTWTDEAAVYDSCFTAPSSPFTVTVTGRTTTAANTVTIAKWMSSDANTWDTLSGTGWTSLGDAQDRNLGGDGPISGTWAYNIKTSAGATGDVSKNQATLGGDDGETTLTTFALTMNTPIVTTDSAGSVDFHSENLVGSITNAGGENATQNGFAYGTDSTLVTVVATTTLGGFTGTGSFNGTVGSLSPSATYYYRAYATNSAGTGFGSIKSFTTAAFSPVRRMLLFKGVKIKIIGQRVKI